MAKIAELETKGQNKKIDDKERLQSFKNPHRSEWNLGDFYHLKWKCSLAPHREKARVTPKCR
jgi:hypothetical protein